MLRRGPHPKIHIVRPFIKPYPLFMDGKLLMEMYVEKRLSTKEIASELKAARSTILKYLKIHCVPLRRSGVNIRKRPGFGLAYGKRIVNRQEIINKREQDAIAKMRDLRSQGFSYWKIADIFNTLRVPTKTGRGQWHARSIQQILDSNAKTEGNSS